MSKQIDVLEELEEIAKIHKGVLRPADVVEFAKAEDTALHSKFEWDDSEAAQQYRLWQARQIIRVNITMLPNETDGKPVKVFVSMKSDRYNDGGGYRYLQDIMSEAESRERLLAQAYDELKVWRRKYQTLKELAPVFEAMDEVSTDIPVVKVKAKAKRNIEAQPVAA
jgi:hypothetical protein